LQSRPVGVPDGLGTPSACREGPIPVYHIGRTARARIAGGAISFMCRPTPSACRMSKPSLVLRSRLNPWLQICWPRSARPNSCAHHGGRRNYDRPILCVLCVLCGLNFTDWLLMPPLLRHPCRERGWGEGRKRWRSVPFATPSTG